MFSEILKIFQTIFPPVFIIYLFTGLFLAGVVHIRYNEPILKTHKKVQEIKEKYSKKTGLKSIVEPRMQADIEPLYRRIDELEMRRRFFLDNLRVVYPWIRV